MLFEAVSKSFTNRRTILMKSNNKMMLTQKVLKMTEEHFNNALVTGSTPTRYPFDS